MTIRQSFRAQFGSRWALVSFLFISSSCAERTETTVPPVSSAPSGERPIGVTAAAEQKDRPVREQILTLSPRAAERLKSMIEKSKLKPTAIVQIGVAEGTFFRLKQGGDKRYRYTLLFDDAPKNLGQFVEMESQGLTVLIDKKSAEFLRGTEVLMIETVKGKGGLKFQNPNEMTDDEAAVAEEKSPSQIVTPEEPSSAPTQVTPTPIAE